MSKHISVMISSRCNDPILLRGATSTLSDVRGQLKQEIEDHTIFGGMAFDCWINEDAPPAAGDESSWEHCLKQAKNADILVCLFNGDAGWAKTDGGIGICHAELEAALASGAAKVRLIEMPLVTKPKKALHAKRNELFQRFVSDQSLFRGRKAEDGEEVVGAVKDALHDAVIDMVRLGHRETRKGKYDTGQALNWSRLNYQQRKAEIERVLESSLSGEPPESGDAAIRVVMIATKQVLVHCHGVPSAMGVAAAREMVGRPFLFDHESTDLLQGSICGPIHLIGCHQSVTENQAASILGFPDATIVKTSFGIYVADDVQKIQLVFLANCRDESSTRHAVQRFLVWLDSSGEGHYLADRAASRRRIVQTISKEALKGR